MRIVWKRICCLALVLAALASLSACGTHETPTMSESAIRQALVGKTWTLRRIVARDFDEEPARTLKFDADGKVEGFGGCNHFTGTYTLTDDHITFGPLASTRKSCGPGMDEKEYTFMTMLARISSLSMEDGSDELTLLTDSQGEVVFTSGDSGLFW